MKKVLGAMAAAMVMSAPAAAAVGVADVQITEWMYSGSGGEFIEFTNMGSAAVDFSGWSYDDDSATPGGFDLSGFGLVGVGESVVITEDPVASFRSAWGLDASVKVLGGYTNNIGRNDAINLFDGSGSLIDSFAYGDQDFAGTIRTQGQSGNPLSAAALADTNVTTDWTLAFNGDGFGSYLSANGDAGNPGSFIFAPVPEPSGYALMLAGLALVGGVARRSAR